VFLDFLEKRRRIWNLRICNERRQPHRDNAAPVV
jgi:hypothetical protein